ncbi:MAG: UDP-N-acetylglucosamine 2-epimerase (non-hydrolyzing) [Candidatus Zixiibacteriota bacterium]
MHNRDDHGVNYRRIALVAGARPNFVKIAPLVQALRRSHDQFEPIIIHTGQHYDQHLSDVFFSELAIPSPDVHLGIGSGTHAEQTARALIGIERFLLDHEPDFIICVGDVNSTLACALAAAKCGIPCAHVESGLRSRDRSMPEEINRIVADHTADWLYTTCADAGDNLRREGIDPDRIVFVGNIMIDTMMAQMDRIIACDSPAQVGVRRGEYLLLTMHRPVNVDDPEHAGILLDIIHSLTARHKIVFPIHPRTKARLSDFGGGEEWAGRVGRGNLILCEPQGYIEFLALQKSALAVLTDSGGVQEETTMLGVPCLTLRTNTERPVTITEGTNRLVGLDLDRILAVLDEIQFPHPVRYRHPRFWDGKTAGRIVAHLARVVTSKARISRTHRVAASTAPGAPGTPGIQVDEMGHIAHSLQV